MPPPRTRIPFFLDNNVPDSVGTVLQDSGHDVTRLREVMDRESADPVIAIACARGGQVLVTHDRDFRSGAERLNISRRQYRESLHRIQLRCPEPKSAERIIDALAVIEVEWQLVRVNRPMVIHLHSASIRIDR